jgi:hypothetical protein
MLQHLRLHRIRPFETLVEAESLDLRGCFVPLWGSGGLPINVEWQFANPSERKVSAI